MHVRALRDNILIHHIKEGYALTNKPKLGKKSGSSFRFSPRILDHLGVSAYNSVQKCLSELTANAYDADATVVRITVPSVLKPGTRIEIADNGIGMSKADIEQKYLFIGRNKREEGQCTASGRLLIGSKGIGKLAGFGIARIVELESIKGGHLSKLTIDRKTLDNSRALSDHQFDIVVVPTKKRPGTILRLARMGSELHLPSDDVIRRHLFRTLPKTHNFSIFLNNVECTSDDVPGERSEFAHVIDGVGKVAGFYVVANVRQTSPGLAVRVRGRIVKEPTLFGLDTRTHGFFTAEKIIGEINADFLDPESGDPKVPTQELINTSRDGFLTDSPIVKKFDAWVQNFLKTVVQGVDKTETKKRTDVLLSKPGIRDRLEKLPPHLRGTATSVVRSLVSKLGKVEDDDAEELLEWIVRYYESNVLRELMLAISSADISDMKRLGALVQEWGLKQVNSVVDIIKGQIEIIQKLEKATARNSSKEIEVHELVEANLWLIREGLELWTSDKSLKTLLDARVKKLYKEKQNLRPDIVCRSRSDLNEAVILEFKRPKELIKLDHVTQVMEYGGLVKKHRPNLSIQTYVVGRQYDPSVLTMKENLDKAGIHLRSLHEVLQGARMRFEKILKILGR
jgi:hypothetical protein